MVDSLAPWQVEAGRLPKAYHMDPSAMENPEDIAEVKFRGGESVMLDCVTELVRYLGSGLPG